MLAFSNGNEETAYMRPAMDGGEAIVTSVLGERQGHGVRTVSMQPVSSILCDARDAQGNPCGATAAVRRVHYKYTAELDRRAGEVQQVLREAQYDIDCPRCGLRTQLEKLERS